MTPRTSVFSATPVKSLLAIFLRIASTKNDGYTNAVMSGSLLSVFVLVNMSNTL